MITEWRIGQRVYYHYPPLSAHKCYGDIVEWGQGMGRVWFHIRFDDLGIHRYENQPDLILIHPHEPAFVESTWEL